jgi:glutathione synthase/RimK-type ligase-like ATP-grasp enzyme
MSSPRIAIATCADYEQLKVDDELLRAALEERGCEARAVVWDEEGADWARFDLCLIRSTWDYHEKHREFLAWAQKVETVTPLRNPVELIAWNSDKAYLRELAEQGIRIVPTVWIDQSAAVDLDEVLAGERWDEAVVKPAIDLGARNLHLVRAGAGSGALEAVLRRGEAMVQPFLPSLEEKGELSLVYIEGAFSYAVRKRPAPGDFRVQPIWGGTFSCVQPEAEQVALAEQVLAQLDEAPLYARVDLVEGLDANPCLIELELIEPNLYLSQHPPAATLLANAALKLL